MSTPEARPAREAAAVRHVGLVGGSLVVWAIGSYAYFLIAGRVVGPATYGLVSALTALLALIVWPCTALQWSMARVLASTPDAHDDAAAAYRQALIQAAVAAAALCTAGVLAAVVAHELNDDVPTGALVATCLSAAPLLPYFVSIGALQGEGRYGGYSVSWALTGALRAPLMVPFLALAAGSAAAVVLGSGLAVVAGLAVALWLTRADLRVRREPSEGARAAFGSGLGATVLGLAGFASLVSLGVVVANLRLPDDPAGYYGAASTLGRAVLMIPQAVAIVLLPRVARRRTGDLPTGALLALGALATVVVGFASVVFAEVAGEPLIAVTFGDSYAPAAALLPQLLAASTLLGVLFILVNHHAARSEHRFAWAVVAVAAVHVAGLIAFGTSANAIIAIDAAAALLAVTVHELMYRDTGDSLVRGAVALMRRGRRETT